MKVLITGGTGLIGTALTKRLLADKQTVVILSRNPSAHFVKGGIQLAAWDGKSAAGWGHLVNEVDAVVNLAGVNLGGGLWTQKRKAALLSSRVNAGKAVVEAIRQADQKPKVLIQASAVGYYAASGETEILENCPAGDDFQGTLCQQWEESTRQVEEMGVRRVIIRSGVVFEKEAFLLKMFLLPFRMLVGGPLGSGRQFISWIHIEDEINGILNLLQDDRKAGAYNLMAPQPVRNADLGRAIGRVLHRPYWFPVPGFALRAVLGELSSVVLDSWRGIPGRLLESGFTFKYPDVESALKDLVGR